MNTEQLKTLKKGDKVRCVNTTGGNITPRDRFVAGHEYTVNDTDPGHRWNIYVENVWCEAENFEPVTTAPYRILEPGEKVQKGDVILGWPIDPTTTVGTAPNAVAVRVWGYASQGRDAKYCAANVKDGKIVVRPVKKEPQFKEGDKVRWSAAGQHSGITDDLIDGNIYIVQKVDSANDVHLYDSAGDFVHDKAENFTKV